MAIKKQTTGKILDELQVGLGPEANKDLGQIKELTKRFLLREIHGYGIEQKNVLKPDAELQNKKGNMTVSNMKALIEPSMKERFGQKPAVKAEITTPKPGK